MQRWSRGQSTRCRIGAGAGCKCRVHKRWCRGCADVMLVQQVILQRWGVPKVLGGAGAEVWGVVAEVL